MKLLTETTTSGSMESINNSLLHHALQALTLKSIAKVGYNLSAKHLPRKKKKQMRKQMEESIYIADTKMKLIELLVLAQQ